MLAMRASHCRTAWKELSVRSSSYILAQPSASAYNQRSKYSQAGTGSEHANNSNDTSKWGFSILAGTVATGKYFVYYLKVNTK